MKINSEQNRCSFNGMWTNKTVLKGLETISEHSTSFAASTSFLMSTALRPAAIALTPNIKKENKEYAITNSIASGIIKFMILEAIALPIENAIKKIEKTPKKFLNPKTIKFFGSNSIQKSRDFKFATQFLKQSTGFITAIPKSIATVALIPVLTEKFFNNKAQVIHPHSSNKNCKTFVSCRSNNENNKFTEKKSVFSKSFKGGFSDIPSKLIGKILDNSFVQNTAKKFSKKDADISRNMTISTDILLSTSFAIQTKKNKSIDEDCKKPLILNNFYSTFISIAGGFTVDEIIKKNTKKFIENFKQLHKNNPKLNKYIEGINIVRPTIIFASIYYGILPAFTTYLADKTGRK